MININQRPLTSGASTGLPQQVEFNGHMYAVADTSDGSDSTSAANAVSAQSNDPTSMNALSLSPDSLMAYCQSRLNSLDDQMTSIFTSQQNNAKITQDLNQISSAFNQLPAPDSSNPPQVAISADQINSLQAAYETAINDAGGPSTALGQTLTKDAATLPAAGSSDTKLSADTTTQLTQDLKNLSGELNSDSELSMINLQSLMSQRQTAVQLTTNLVQALGQQAQDISKNVGA